MEAFSGCDLCTLQAQAFDALHGLLWTRNTRLTFHDRDCVVLDMVLKYARSQTGENPAIIGLG